MTTKISQRLRQIFNGNGCTGTSLLRLMQAFALALLLSVCSSIQGQSAYTTFYQSAVVYSGIATPGGIAVDSLGNIYIADFTNNQVLLETLQGNGTYVQSTIGSGLQNPYGVAVDASFNVYVTDTDNRRVLKETPIGGGVYTQTVISSTGFSAPYGIAVDSIGNLYVCDPILGEVIEEAYQSPGIYHQAIILSPANGLISPYGVAVDSTFNVFIADTGIANAVEFPWVSFSASAPINVGTYSTKVLFGTSISSPKGVAVDGHNNVYVASTGTQEIFEEILQSGGGYSQTTVATGLPTVDAVAVDARGNVYGGMTFPTPEVVKFSVFDGNFGQVNDGSTSPVLTLTFSFQSGGVLNNIEVVTGGATGLDFANAGTGSCMAGTNYSTGATCTVDVIFTPLYSGTRYGAVEMFNLSGNLFATGYIFGTGVGPQLVYLPGVENTIATNFPSLTGVAVDGSENVYLSGWGYAYAFEITAASDWTFITEIGGGFSSLSGTATDGAGNVYVSDWGQNIVYKMLAADNFLTVVQMSAGLDNPSDMTVDGDGNVYISNYGNSEVNEILASTNYTVAINIATNFTNPSGIAVDGGGDVFLDNYNNGKIYEIKAIDGAIPFNPTPVQIGTGANIDTGVPYTFSSPQGIKCDDNGNVYVSDQNHSHVVEILASTGYSNTYTLGCRPPTCASGPYNLPAATDVAIDAQGNIYVPNNGDNSVVRIDVGDPPSLTFDATPVGSTSPDSPQTVTLQNIGNVALTFPIPSSGNDPSISTNFTLGTGGSDCPITSSGSSSAGSLGVNAQCNLAISFSPVVLGTVAGQVTLTDNVLYAVAPLYATQIIPLNGTGGGDTMTMTAGSYTVPYGNALPTFGYSLSGPLGTTSCTGSPSIAVDIYGTTTSAGSPPYAVGQYSLVITQGSLVCEPQYTVYNPINGVLTISKPAGVLILTSTNAGPIPYNTAIPNLSSNYTLTGFVSPDTFATACTGTPVLSTLAVQGSPAGSYTITASVGGLICNLGTAIYTVFIRSTGKLTITPTTTITWTPVPATISFGTKLIAGELDAHAFDGATNIDADGTFTYYLNTVGGPAAVAGTTVPPLGTTQLCVQFTPLSADLLLYSPATDCVPFTVTPAASLTVTATSYTITYGAGTPSISPSVYNTNFTVTGFTGSDTFATACTGSPTMTYSPSPATPAAAGTYAINITAGTLSCPSYSAPVLVNGTLTVNKAPALTVTASSYTIPYGAAIPIISPAAYGTSFTVTGFVGSDTFATACGGTLPTLTYSPASPANVGVYTITPTIGTLSCPNYTAPPTFVNGTLTINKAAALNFTATSYTIPYGAATPPISPAVYGTNFTAATFAGSDTFATACGGTSPTLTYSPVPGSPAAVGTYAINISAGSLNCPNYNAPTFTNGTLVVNKATATLTLTSANGSGTYGTTPAVSSDYTLTGFQGTDTKATVCTGGPSVTTVATATSAVSPPTYQITATKSTLACNGSSTTTYTIVVSGSPQVGQYTQNQGTTVLTWTPSLSTITYGTALVAGELDAKAKAGTNNVTSDGTFTYYLNTVGGPAAAVGTVPPAGTTQLCVQFTPKAAYTTDITTATKCVPFTVTKVAETLTLTSVNGTGAYGVTPVVTGDYSLTGFQGTDTQASVCGATVPTVTTTATNTSAPGAYPITAVVGGLVCNGSTDYTYTVVLASPETGVYTVTKVAETLTLTSVNGTGAYGVTPVVTGDYSLTGFQGSDTQASVCGATVPTVTTTATNTSAPGAYPITAVVGGLVCNGSTDYTYTVVLASPETGVYTVTKVAETLTLTSVNGTGAYGVTPVVTGDYSLTGFQGSDTQASVCTGSPSVTTTATNASAPGTYPITAAMGTLACAGSTDYTYTVVLASPETGVYTVTKVAETLTLTSVNGTGTYGVTPVVTGDYSLTGFQGSDTQASVCGATVPTVTTTATNTSAPGAYPITAVVGGLVCNGSTDYTYTVVLASPETGVYTVTKVAKTLTLTSVNGTGAYGVTPVVTGDYSLTGFQGTDTQASVCGATVPTVTTTATNTSAPGAYPITAVVGGLVCNGSTDYTYTVVLASPETGLYTVTKVAKTLTLTSVNGTGAYGVTPVVTGDYSLTGFQGSDTQASVCTGSPSVTTTATNASAPGTYPITAAMGTLACAGSTDYTYTVVLASPETGVYTVTKVAETLTLTSVNGTGAYGVTPVVTGDYSLTGFQGSDTQASVCTGSPSVTTTATNASAPGTYPITAAMGTLACAGSADYTYTVVLASPETGLYTVTKVAKTLTLTSVNGTGAYGVTPVVTGDYSLTGFQGTDTQASVCGATVPTVTTTATNTSAPGAYPITAVVGGLVCNGSTDYTYTVVLASPETGLYTVTKVAETLTLTSVNGTGAYGVTPVVTGDYSLTGFQGSDTQASVCTGSPSVTTTATNASAPGTYPITAAMGTLACAGSTDYTYTVVLASPETGVYTVTKVAETLTLTSVNGTGAYGVTPVVTGDYSLTGFQGSDTQASVCTGSPSVTTTATNASAPGTYPITAAMGTLACAGSTDYTYTVVLASPETGVYTVTKVAETLTLTSVNGTGAYGVTPVVTGDYSLTGFQGTDTQASVCGATVPTVTTTATNTSAPGAYPITAVVGGLVCNGSTDYTYTVVLASPETGVYTVTKVAETLTLTSVNGTGAYGVTPVVTGDYSLTGFQGSDTQASVCGATVPTVTTTATNTSAPGAYPITAVVGGLVCNGSTDYTYTVVLASPETGVYTVTKVAETLTLTSVNGTGAYGVTPVVTGDYSLTGFQGSDTQASVCTGSPSVTTTATNASAPGTYPITAAMGTLACAGSTDYTYTVVLASPETGVYTVTKVAETLTLTSVNGTGTYGVTPVVTGDYSLTGFQGSDTQASVCGATVPTVTTTATNTSAPGAYPITAVVGGLVCNGSTDYTYTVVLASPETGVYTVTKVAKTLTLTSVNGTGAYGVTPVVTGDYSLTGFQGTDTQASVCGATVPTVTTTATNTSAPGAYPITAVVGGLVCNGSTDYTYTVVLASPETGLYTVTKVAKTLTLTSVNGTGAYGVTPVVTGDYSLTGFQGSDTQASVCTGSPSVTTTATNASAPGTYPITAAMGTLACAGSTDYTYTVVLASPETGVYTVTKVAETLTLTSVNGTGAYGVTPVVTGDYSLTGFQGSDTQASVCTGSPSVTTTATNASAPGTYPITAAMGTLACAGSADYTYTVVLASPETGLYTVTKVAKTLTLTSVNGTGAYGVTPVVTGDYSLTGFQGTDTQASVCGATVPTVTTTATNTSAPGAYPITAVVGGLVCNGSTDYTYTVVLASPETGVYTVTKVAETLTLTSVNGTGAYGVTPVVTGDYSLTGFQGSDTQASVCTGSPSVTTTATNASAPGTYPITAAMGTLACAGSTDYTYTVVLASPETGVYTVTKVAETLTLTSVNGTGAYGVTPVVTGDYSLTGFQGSDTQASVCTGSPSVTTTATNASAPGTYPITAAMGTLACAGSTDYTYTVVLASPETGVYTVTKVAETLTLTSVNGTGAYGVTPVVTGDYSLTGFQGSDTQASVCTGSPSVTTTATNASAPGTYPITAAMGTLACAGSTDYTYTVVLASPETGVYTVTKVAETLTLTSVNGTGAYGVTPVVTGDYSLTGFQGSDTQASVCTGSPSVTTTATNASAPGTYPITAAMGTLACAGSTDYTYTVVLASPETGVYTVTKVAETLTLTSVNGTGAYGVTPVVTGDYSLTGFQGSDTQASVCTGSPSVTTTATNASAPGTYPITAAMGTLACAGSTDYTYTVVLASPETGVYTVTKVAETLTLTSVNGTGAYGVTPVVTGDYSLTGFQGSDTQASVCTGSPSVTTTATNASAPGTYPITAAMGTLACAGSTDYTYTVVLASPETGVYTVTKVAETLTLTSVNGTGAYGVTPVVTGDYSLTGFQGSDTQASVCTGSPSVTTTATNASAPGTYPITAAMGTLACAGSTDYTYTVVLASPETGLYTVTKVAETLTLTSVNGTGAYGVTPVVTGDYSLTGFQGSDTQASVCTGSPSVTTTATNASAPGTYPITAAMGTLACAGSTDYTYTVVLASPETGVYTVTKVAETLTLTSVNGTGAYGVTPVVTGDYSLTGFQGSDTQASVCTGSPSVTTTATNASAPGTYPITAAMGTLACAGSTDYTYTVVLASPETGVYTVTKVAETLTLTSVNGTGAYGVTPVVTGDYSLTGFQGSDTQASVCTGSPSVTTTATNASAPGTYPITAAMGTLACAGSTDYTYTVVLASPETGVYTVTKVAETLTLTSVNGTGAYGVTPVVTGDYSLTGFQGSDTQASVCTGSPSVTTTATNASAPGTYPITAAMGTLACAGSTDYTYTVVLASPETGVYTVTKVAETLTLTSVNGTGAYGVTPVVTGDYSLTGFQGSDTQASVCGATVPTVTTTATNTSAPGAYPITAVVGGLVCNGSTDYTYTVVLASPETGVYTVTKVAETLTLTSVNGTGAYGVTPVVTGDYSLTGFQGSDTQASVCTGSPSVTTTATNTSAPGTYPITAAMGTLACAGSTDYTYTVVLASPETGLYTVTQYTGNLVLTSVNGSSPYGAPNVTSDYSLTGFLPVDTQATACTGSPSVTTTATVSSPVSPPTYPITAAVGGLNCTTANAAYTITIGANLGQLTITKATATLTLTSTNGTSAYGVTPVVSGDYSLSGFINGDSQLSACTGAPTVTTTATATSPASPPTYPITAAINGMTCSSSTTIYTIVLGSNSGQLTINAAVLTLDALSSTAVYAQPIPTPFSYTLTGFVNGQSQATACTGAPVLTTVAVQGSLAGLYTINLAQGTLVCPSYAFVYNTGLLKILPATLTVTPNPATVTYNSEVITYGYTITGFVNGDTQSVVSGVPTITSTAISRASSTYGVSYYASPVGTYALNATYGSLNASNYTFAFVPSTLTIIQAPTYLTITAVNVNIMYASQLPATFRYTATGLLGFDTAADAGTGTPSLTSTATTSSPAGTYPITVTAGTFSAPNYAGVNYVNGTVTIIR